MVGVLLFNLGVILTLVTLLWMVSVALRDASIIDPFWGTGFVALAWLTAAQVAPTSTRDYLILAMVTLWGLRLSLYLLWRNAGAGEDRRYAQMRARNDPGFWWKSWYMVFALQGVLTWIIGMAVQVPLASEQYSVDLGLFDFVGMAVYGIGLFFEAVGDWQLTRFKGDPANAGRVMDRGLWRYTRHPNYFGDFCVWWGMYLVAVAAGAWWTVFGPAIMSYFLLRISGVTLLERDIADRRPEYRRYQEATSTFFPWFPRTN